MAGTGAGYDLSVTTFSPDGRVFQVEYAAKAVENSGTAIAMCCSDGVVFAVEKFMMSKMLVEGTNKRIFPIDKHAGMAVAGLVADARLVVSRARDEVKNWMQPYKESIPPHILAERLGMFMHAYTLYWSIRPFGCSVILGMVDPETKKPSLFCVEPSGLVFKYKATAIGKGRQIAKTEIEKLCDNKEGCANMTCKEALEHMAKIIHKVHDEKDRDFELECSWICPESDYVHTPVPKDMLKEAEDKAKKALEAEDED